MQLQKTKKQSKIKSILLQDAVDAWNSMEMMFILHSNKQREKTVKIIKTILINIFTAIFIRVKWTEHKTSYYCGKYIILMFQIDGIFNGTEHSDESYGRIIGLKHNTLHFVMSI